MHFYAGRVFGLHPEALPAFSFVAGKATEVALTNWQNASLSAISEYNVKILNSIMTVIGWIVAIAALSAALGFGFMHLRYGPVDVRIPVRGR